MATHSSILAGKFHGQRSLAGYGPWSCKAGWLSMHTRIRTISSVSQSFIWSFTVVSLFNLKTKQTSFQILNLHPQNPGALTLLWGGKEIPLSQFWNGLWDLGVNKAQAKGKKKIYPFINVAFCYFGFYTCRWRGKILRMGRKCLYSGESQGQGSLVGCRLWGRTESDTTEAT